VLNTHGLECICSHGQRDHDAYRPAMPRSAQTGPRRRPAGSALLLQPEHRQLGAHLPTWRLRSGGALHQGCQRVR
ncbi:dTDP-4-dehydrorhamnose reductase, partial [Clarias magur]